MKLRRYNKTNSIFRGTIYRPAIAPRAQNGDITFNKPLQILLKLQEGDKIEFFQDKRNKNTWYMTVVEKGDGFVVRRTGTLLITNREVNRKLRQLVANKNTFIKLPVNENPVEYNGMFLYKIEIP